jgi:hypothetical protein
MQTRQCSWCSKTVDRTMNFCSEKCRHEYNTAKGTDQGMVRVPEPNEIASWASCWSSALFVMAFFVAIFLVLLLVYFLISIIERSIRGW